MSGIVLSPSDVPLVAYLLDSEDRTIVGPVPMLPGRTLTMMVQAAGTYRPVVYAATGCVWRGGPLYLGTDHALSLGPLKLALRAA